MTKTFHVLIEQDEDGGFIGKVQSFEVLGEEKATISEKFIKFVGVQEITV